MPKPATLVEWETTYNDLATAIGRSFAPGVDPVDEHASNVAAANGLSAQLAALQSERDALRAQCDREAALAAARTAGLTDEQIRLIAGET